MASLYAAGLDDRGIVDVNQVVAYFNYVNRIAHGLGVELEPRWPEAIRVHRDYPLACSPARLPSIRGEDLPWVTVDQMREIDRLMVQDAAIDLPRMMENAGRSLAVLARRFLGDSAAGKRVMVLAGSGGNGGGSLVAGRHLAGAGAEVLIALSAPPERLSPVTGQQYEIASRLGLDVVDDPHAQNDVDLVLDGILGYGQRGAPRARAAELIDWCSDKRVLALDVPSGLELSSGLLHEPHVTAVATLTLALPKQGLRAAWSAVGELFLADISVPGIVYDRLGLSFSTPFSRGPIVQIRGDGDRPASPR